MEIQLVDGNGNVIETVETANFELSDDLGFSVDHLRGANDDLPDNCAEIRVVVPEQS